MEFITTGTSTTFNTEGIQNGDLFFGKYEDWEQGKEGFVSAVTPGRITVQYHPPIGNITNHFHIEIGDVIAGKWLLRHSRDLSSVDEYVPQMTSELDDPDSIEGE